MSPRGLKFAVFLDLRYFVQKPNSTPSRQPDDVFIQRLDKTSLMKTGL